MKKIFLCITLILLIGCENKTTINQDSEIVEVILEEKDPYFNDGNYDIKKYDEASIAPLDLSHMSLEDKVAQLFILDFSEIDNKNETEYSRKIEAFLDLYPIGGFIYFSDNIISKSQLSTFNEQLQGYARTHKLWPFFISVDEEGGLVSRLGKKGLVTYLPNATTLSRTYTSEEIFEMGKTLGSELKSLGFNMDFAPVLDTNINANNPIIGTRAFSSDPKTVAEYAIAFGKGLYASGIIPFGKHYPGHGNTQGDSHLTPVTSTLDEQGFYTGEGLPFVEAVKQRLPGIMVGHILTPNLSDNSLPASLSDEVVEGILRQDLHYDELIITDALEMKAISSQYSSGEAAVLALQAGCDLLLMPEDFEEAYDYVLKSVYDGTLSEIRINQSLERIYRYKRLLK
ncbi:MAG: hypothetical protein JXR88_04810 [Clostridia bacterium]|nr:hypothetical protein [Clostridia bacterium]